MQNIDKILLVILHSAILKWPPFFCFLGGHSPTSTSDFFRACVRACVRAVCVPSFEKASKGIVRHL